MATRKKIDGNAVVGAVGETLLGVAARALGAAVESVLEDVSSGLHNVDEKVTRTKKKVASTRRGRKVEAVDAEVIDDTSRRH